MRHSWPYRPGTLVIARLSNGIPIHTGCADHVFQVGKASKVDYGCGWIQPATCLVCNEPTVAIDAEWFHDRAEPEDIERCIRLIRTERHRLARALIKVQLLGSSVE